MHPTLQELRAWYEERKSKIISNYIDFLKIPSISTDPAYAADVRRAAGWVADSLKRVGFHVELWETKKHPIVFASRMVDEKAPTVLIYHHYDVQPVDPLEKWKSPPFEPAVVGDQVYARGASDNKGQCFYTLTALEALMDLCKDMHLNIKVFVEGEEECGSEGAFQILQEKQKDLKADAVLVVDSSLPAPGVPAITLGLRGVMALEVRCKNSRVDLHSGMHGGVALNPNRVLVQLLAKCWDAHGKITIPGFYEGIEELAEDERKEVSQEIDLERLKKEFGLRAFQGEGGFSLWESNTVRPTLEINGMAGGYAGAGFKTVIPAEAVVKVSCRLVPGQDPQKIADRITAFLKKEAPEGIALEIVQDHGAPAIRTSSKTKLARLCSEAYAEVFEKPCKNILCGASIPLTTGLAKATGGEIAIIGVGLDTDDIHAPNEHFGLDRLLLGFLTIGRILMRMGQC